MKNYLFSFSLSFLLGVNAYAADVPQSFTLDGQLFSDAAGTTPLLDSMIGMKIQILDEARVCVLYEESQTVNTVFSKGYFSVQVGSATGDAKRGGDDTGNAMSTIFQNISNVTGKKVSDSSPCTVTAAAAKRRYVRISISPASMGGAPRLLSPDLTIDSVPNAVVAERAESLQGLRGSDVLKVNTSAGSALSQSNLESLFTSTTRFNALSSIVDGTSTSYMQTSAAGAQLPVFTGAPTSPTQGSIWFDTSDQKIKYRTGTNTTEILTTGASGIAGSGTTGRFPYFSAASTLSDSSMYYNGGNIGIGADPGTTIKFAVSSGTASGTVADIDDNASGRTTGTILAVDSDAGNLTGYNLFRVTNANTVNSKFVIRGDGNVGIGNSSPATLLDIRKDGALSTFQNLITLRNNTTADSDVGMAIDYKGINDKTLGRLVFAWDGGSGNENNADYSVFLRGAGAPYEAFRMNYSGTTTINGRTNAGNSSHDALILTHTREGGSAFQGQNGIGSTIAFEAMTATAGTTARTATIDAIMDDATNTSKDSSLRFSTIGPNAGSGTTTPSERMRISSAGYLGVGVTDPASSLDVVGAITNRGMGTAPATSPAGQGRIYFDTAANKYKVSENNGAYVDLVGAGAAISGTAGKLPKFATASTIGDSLFSESGTTMTLSGILALPTTSSTVGQITFNSVTGLHMKGTTSVFVGGAGNLTTTTTNSVGMGYQALQNLTSGTYNTAIGAGALKTATNSDNNTAVGRGALGSADAYKNTAVGDTSLASNTSGGENTAVGYYSMAAATTGNYNTALGDLAGYTGTAANALTTGSSNTFIGYDTGFPNTTQRSGATAIGAGARVNQDNSLVLGATGTKVGIGSVTAPTGVLDVPGDVNFRGTTTPGLSAAGQGRIYFDSVSNTFKISSNGNAYTELVGTTTTGTSGKILKFGSNNLVTDSIVTEGTGQISVAGQILSTGATDQTSNAPNISFNNGNALYITSACTALTLSNMVDGGSYSLAVKNTSGTCSFTHAGTTVRYAGGVSNVSVTSYTVFTFMRLGNDIFVTWVNF